MTCQPPVRRLTVPSGATSSTATESIPLPPMLSTYRCALIGPWNRTALVTGAESKVTPARSLMRLSSRHGLGSGLWPMMPAVHWLVERVHSPATGMGSTVAVPSCAVPVVRPPGVPLLALPDSFQDEATRSLPTQLLVFFQESVPCS